MLGPLAAARTFLQGDVLKNIVPLKMLEAYGPAITCHYRERDGDAGALLLLPTAVSPYDAAAYPDAEWVVLLSTTSAAIAEALLERVPMGAPLVFKLFDPANRIVAARRFALRRVTSYISYTSPAGREWPLVPGVAVSETLNERILDIFVARGHDRAEVQYRFRRGQAVSFALEVAGELAAVCYVYHNFGPVWELASVYTVPSARRAGYGRRVVSAALHTLAQRRLVPRYHVEESNAPSIRLASSLGLTPFVTIEHFVTGAPT